VDALELFHAASIHRRFGAGAWADA